ncbi:hypothetical protein B0H14DRAFT_2577681 [Mycena olivaceomarginata]|nr:hypothetical protein B0H14DRAFT_2577681 [Mycena olivaceomarginata]
MPFGHAAELEKYMLVYIERAALLYAISFEVSRRSEQPMTLDPSVYWCLSQAVTFDYFLGRLTYATFRVARDSFLSHISMAANLANKARGPSLVLDVPLTPDFASLPQVTVVESFANCVAQVAGVINSWACENALSRGRDRANTKCGRALEKSVTHVDMEYAPNPSGRYFACSAQEEKSHETVGLICDVISVLLKNMVALGKASLKYGAMEGAESHRYFVPSEGTTLFGMAECFVDLCGYHRDGSPFDRALMFDNLNTLFRAMVLDKEYLQCGVDFPNFELSKVDLERYRIYEFIKPRQIARVHAEDPRIIWHQFGDRLLRCNPKLGEAARYTFPDPSQEMEEDGEELDKENESP